MKKSVFALLLIMLAVFVAGFSLMPQVGSFPKKPGGVIPVSEYYITNTVPDAGAANSVAAIVWHFRGYDTMGEVTILFTAIAGAVFVATMGAKK